MSDQSVITIQEYQHAQLSLSKRRFDESMAYARQVLDMVNATGEVLQNVRAIHLIVEINNTKGRYDNDSKLYSSSLMYLEEAQKLLSQGNFPKKYLWDIHLTKVKTYLLLENFSEAEELLDALLSEDVILHTHLERKINGLLAYSEFHYLQNEYDEAISLVETAFDELTDADEKLLLEIYTQAVRIYLRRHEYSEILEYGTKTLELSRKYNDSEKEFIGLNSIAVYYGTKYDFKMAMLYFRNALDKSTEIDYRYGTAYCLINIGTIYANLFNYNEALDRYMTVLQEYEDVLDDSTGLIIMNNVGNIYFTVGKLNEALEYFERSLSIAESIQYNEMKAHTMAQISRTLVAQKRYKEALDYAFKSEELIEDSGNLEGKQINYITLGNIYYKLDNHDLAMKYVGKGIVCAKQVKDSVSEIRGYRLMSNIFKEKGNFEKALEYQLVYSQAQEKYAMDQRNRQIIDIEIRYDFEQKEKEIELLKKYKNTLVAQHDKIVEQNEKLIDVNNDLMQFAYAVSHDLKEPLRMIGSYSQLIQRRYAAHLEDSSDEFFNYVNEGVSRMTKLLDDLLKYATIGKSDDQDWEEVDLQEIFDVTTFSLKLAIEESNAKITSTQLPNIYTNRAYISQLFQNLISNAIKFRKKDENPLVAVSYRKEGTEHYITFQDNGIGIPADALERIFVIFQRLHKRSGYSGTGIGLSICMKIIERLGGTITVESEQGEGSIFTVILPEEPELEDLNQNDTSFFLDDGL